MRGSTSHKNKSLEKSQFKYWTVLTSSLPRVSKQTEVNPHIPTSLEKHELEKCAICWHILPMYPFLMTSGWLDSRLLGSWCQTHTSWTYLKANALWSHKPKLNASASVFSWILHSQECEFSVLSVSYHPPPNLKFRLKEWCPGMKVTIVNKF